MAICDFPFVSALLTMIKFSMHQRVRILDSKANVKGRILQLNTSIPLKCWTGCLFIKLILGRVGMGRVLNLGPSWHGPCFRWAELAWAELVLGRVVLHPWSQCGQYFQYQYQTFLVLWISVAQLMEC